MPNNGMQGMSMQNNMMNNGAMMNNGMGGGMGAQQNMMRPQQPQVSVALLRPGVNNSVSDFLQLSIQMMSARFQQPGMTHSSQAAVQSASMMFNQGADPALGQNPKADPSQSYAQTVDGL